jgi:hypothetical protein
METWNDGRSGVAGCIAGNIAINAINSEQKPIRKLKSTIFDTNEHIIIGRVCASDDYLIGSVLHWANLSWDQHCEIERDAARERKRFLYLFVTASADPVGVRYWLVPADIVRLAIQKRGKDYRGATAAIHIVDDDGRHVLGNADVTSLHAEAALTNEQAQSLLDAMSKRQSRARSGKAEVQDDSGGRISTPGQEALPPDAEARAIRSYTIPISGGRCAQLAVPAALTPGDVVRMKSWLDLMSTVLTEESTATPPPTHDSARAAVQREAE